MDAWADIRLKARESHAKALAAAQGARDAKSLIAAGLTQNDLELRRYEPGTLVGEHVFGWLDRPNLMVNIAGGQDEVDEAVVIAHEIGHFELHMDPRSEVTVLAPGLGGDPIDSGASRVEGYSPRERKEIQADVFAGEFLCPADWLRNEIVAGGRKPSEIAGELGLPPSLVLNQAIRALLLPPLRQSADKGPSSPVELDDSQRKAAIWAGGPVLVDAGPGTGKTRTLVHRIAHLLSLDALPGSILALTFSTKAVEEMRERLSAHNRDAAVEMWVGTFHAFGLELVSKWPSRLGRTEKLRPLDQTGSLALLEANLGRLPLRHFQNLYEPAYDLAPVLQAISRCKDELITPEAYLEAAEAVLAVATEEERDAAEKAVELGRIYKVYQELLAEADAVDFGDLVMLATQLLEQHDDIREEYQGRYEHILVDEYQDVNLASARLLRALAGSCEDVWVVADQRQSIYRFRGAEPSNVARFEAEFGGERLSLSTNYRSGAPVVRAFSQFTGHMAADPQAIGSWESHRGELGEVSLTVMPTVVGEAAAIRERIEELRQQGFNYRNQAILARSHLTLSRITETLEQLGVPMLYLGDLFERSEIRDLLSLVAIDAEFGGIGLVRVGQLPEYGATRQDTLTVLQWAQANEVSVYAALASLGQIDGLTPAGAAGLARLADHLAGMDEMSPPWSLLTTWLFERSDYLRPLLASPSPKAQQQLIAIYHLLKVCGEQLALRDPRRKSFLDRIRRIEALNQDTPYRAVSSEATDFDAVRVMTIHGSKGLEFPVVHLPGLATSYMPASRQGTRCPPPETLAHLGMQKEDHDAEEECLFFVAMSRARDVLCLSRAERYTAKRNASESKFIATIARNVRQTRAQNAIEPAEVLPVMRPPTPRDTYEERELDLYLRCPARYHYEKFDGLHGARDASAYLRFHRCVHRTLGWLETQAAEGSRASSAEARAELVRQWEKGGPKNHPFERYYWAAAEGMVETFANLILSETGQYDRAEWSVTVDGKQVTVTPDRVIIHDDGSVRVQRIRTGRKSKSEPEHRIYALLRRGAAARYPGRTVSVETYYPATGETVPAPPKKDDKLLAEYVGAIAAIELGEFTPNPKDRRQCPNCQCYFICGI
jgi:superfamily I DNA/RNA helicase